MDPPASAAVVSSLSELINVAIATTLEATISPSMEVHANLAVLLLSTASPAPNFLTVHSATIALLANTITHPQGHANYANPHVQLALDLRQLVFPVTQPTLSVETPVSVTAQFSNSSQVLPLDVLHAQL